MNGFLLVLTLNNATNAFRTDEGSTINKYFPRCNEWFPTVLTLINATHAFRTDEGSTTNKYFPRCNEWFPTCSYTEQCNECFLDRRGE